MTFCGSPSTGYPLLKSANAPCEIHRYLVVSLCCGHHRPPIARLLLQGLSRSHFAVMAPKRFGFAAKAKAKAKAKATAAGATSDAVAAVMAQMDLPDHIRALVKAASEGSAAAPASAKKRPPAAILAASLPLTPPSGTPPPPAQLLPAASLLPAADGNITRSAAASGSFATLIASTEELTDAQCRP